LITSSWRAVTRFRLLSEACCSCRGLTLRPPAVCIFSRFSLCFPSFVGNIVFVTQKQVKKMVRPKSQNPRDAVANVRLTAQERADMEEAAARIGLKSLSEYLRHLHRKASPPASTVGKAYDAKRLRRFSATSRGEILLGDSLDYLHAKAKPQSVDLIMTSPPFGLVRKKSYGNEDADRYCDWFKPFAEGFKRVLTETGSLVIDIGGAWIPGQPTRSLYHFKLLVMLVEEYGFHLCQEHYWWNPSKLPTPAEWVNVRRVRVKDAVNSIWWLSKSPFPRANNRRVLQPYSRSMHDLLKNGYKAKLRPSGHDISEKFQRDNGGSVPPNLLAIANTESTSRYQEHCRANSLPIHPARFPAQLPEYFIRMLTDRDDLVLDPFAGSCMTGAVAEALGRQWVCCESSEEYLKGALGRFISPMQFIQKDKTVAYEISAPCSVVMEDSSTPLAGDGGASRPKSPRKSRAAGKPKGLGLPA
jgi:DNA modification methylase